MATVLTIGVLLLAVLVGGLWYGSLRIEKATTSASKQVNSFSAQVKSINHDLQQVQKINQGIQQVNSNLVQLNKDMQSSPASSLAIPTIP